MGARTVWGASRGADIRGGEGGRDGCTLSWLWMAERQVRGPRAEGGGRLTPDLPPGSPRLLTLLIRSRLSLDL